MSHAAITFLVLGTVVVLFVGTSLPVEIVAIGAAFSLYATGVLDLDHTIGGFGDPAVVFIAALFVVSEAIDAAGVSTWVGEALSARAGGNRARLAVLVMLASAALSGLVTINGAVAALLPAVVVMSIRYDVPARLLLPLAFAAHAGSLLTLTGSPVNVIISEVTASAGQRPLAYFEFARVGVPLLAGTIAIIMLFGERLLPRRKARTMATDFSGHARMLIKQYALSNELFRLRFDVDSPNVGHPAPALPLRGWQDVTVVGVQKMDASRAGDGAMKAGDVVIVSGDRDTVHRLATEQRLTLSPVAPADSEAALLTREQGVAEVVIPPRSDMIGERVFPGLITTSGDLVILAVQRKGVDLTTETELAAGDTLLLRGRWDALGRSISDSDLLVVNSPDLVRRRTAPLGSRARKTIGVLLVMVLLLVTGIGPPSLIALLSACVLILLRVLDVDQAYRSISWSAVVLVAAMIPLSTAMHESGAAQVLAEGLVRLVRGAGPYGLLGGLFLLTAILGQVISNTATALVVAPIAVSAANQMNVSVRPVLMTVAVSAAASFLTPIATPVNMMVQGPAGLRFGDYWKLGLPLLLWFFVVSIGLIPLIWRF